MNALEALQVGVKGLLESGWKPREIEAQTQIEISNNLNVGKFDYTKYQTPTQTPTPQQTPDKSD